VPDDVVAPRLGEPHEVPGEPVVNYLVGELAGAPAEAKVVVGEPDEPTPKFLVAVPHLVGHPGGGLSPPPPVPVAPLRAESAPVRTSPGAFDQSVRRVPSRHRSEVILVDQMPHEVVSRKGKIVQILDQRPTRIVQNLPALPEGDPPHISKGRIVPGPLDELCERQLPFTPHDDIDFGVRLQAPLGRRREVLPPSHGEDARIHLFGCLERSGDCVCIARRQRT